MQESTSGYWMKVIIAGSRDVTSLYLVEDASLMSKFDITEVVSGGARGVDRLGEIFAEKNGLPVKVFPADWIRFGKSAGHRRNREMAQYADALVAVWDGVSPGTKGMILEMKKPKKPVFIGLVKNK